MSTFVRLLLVVVILAVAWQFRGGLGDIKGALQTAGWTGIALMALYHVGPMAVCGLAWRSLLPGFHGALFVFSRWIREGVGEIASFLPLSGEVAGARVLTRYGIRPSLAGALTVVDITAELMAQFLFSLIGVGLWMSRHPDSNIVQWSLTGLAVSLPILAAFFFAQRSTLVRFLETLPSRLMPDLWKAPDIKSGVHSAIATLYGDRRRIARAVGIHLLAWLSSTGEAALALAMLGHPLQLVDVVAMESIIFAIRSCAFLIPAAIGVQEGGYVLVGAALGLPPETALAVSLLKRGRELLLGIPALVAWHLVEQRKTKGTPVPAPSVGTLNGPSKE